MLGIILDQSHWNGRCYFPKAIESGAIATFIRYGSINNTTGICYEDYLWRQNVADAETYNFPYGAYFYMRPKFGGVLQGEYFVSLLRQSKTRLPVIIDVEEVGDYRNIIKMAEVIKIAGYTKVGIYTRQSIWDYNYPYDSYWSTLDLWAARWASGLTSPWSDGKFRFRDWNAYKFWQYSADGNARAIEFGFMGYPVGDNDVDLSYYYGTAEDFQNEFGLVTVDRDAYIVITAGLRIRSEPNPYSTIIGQRAVGEIVIPKDYGGGDFWVKDDKGWSAVTYGGSTHMRKQAS